MFLEAATLEVGLVVYKNTWTAEGTAAAVGQQLLLVQ